MLRTTPRMLVVTLESVTVAITTPNTTSAIAEHSIRVSRLPVIMHCAAHTLPTSIIPAYAAAARTAGTPGERAYKRL